MNIQHYALILIAVIIALLVTYLDTYVSLGYGIWVLYLLPILIVSGTKRGDIMIGTTAAIGGFMAVGLLLSPGTITEVKIINRAGNYLVFWIVTLVVASRNRSAQLAAKHASELEAANRDLESFSYSVSHDLRGPLNTITSLAVVLKDNYFESLDSMGRECITYINEGTQKMGMLIEDILNLSRVGRLELNREDINLSELVMICLTELQSFAPERKAEFEVQKDVHAYGDGRLMSVALENLLRNAWKFTSKREVAGIRFGCFISEAKTVYLIRDNGVGFDKKFAKTIFEPFKQAHAQNEFGGTGIGLSIVLRVIERHGGRIWAEGDVDGGATFYFTLGQ